MEDCLVMDGDVIPCMEQKHHKGMDIASRQEPHSVTADGIVEYAGWSSLLAM